MGNEDVAWTADGVREAVLRLDEEELERLLCDPVRCKEVREGGVDQKVLVDLGNLVRNPVEKTRRRVLALRALGIWEASGDLLGPLVRDETTDWRLLVACARECEKQHESCQLCAWLIQALSRPLPEDACSSLRDSIDAIWKPAETIHALIELENTCSLLALPFVSARISREVVDCAHEFLQLSKNQQEPQMEEKAFMLLGSHAAAQLQNGGLERVSSLIHMVAESRDAIVWSRLVSFLRGFVSVQPKQTPSRALADSVDILFKVSTAEGSYFDTKLTNWHQIRGDESVKQSADRLARHAQFAMECGITLLGAATKEELHPHIVVQLLLSFVGWCQDDECMFQVPWSSATCAKVGQKGLCLLLEKVGDPTRHGPVSSSFQTVREVCKAISNPSMLWAFLRERLKQGHWKDTAWQLCNSLLAVLNACERPVVTSDLGEVLPMLLPITDHVSSLVSRPGVVALRHVIEEMTVTEFRWNSALLLHKLENLTSASREFDLLSVVLPTYLQALEKSEARPGPMPNHLQAIDTILSHAKLCGDAKCQSLFLEALRELVSRTQLLAIQFLSDVLSCIEPAAGKGGTQNRRCRETALALLAVLLVIARPLVLDYQSEILAILARHHYAVDTTYRFCSSTELQQAQDAESLLNKNIMRSLVEICSRNETNMDLLQTDIAALEPYVTLQPS